MTSASCSAVAAFMALTVPKARSSSARRFSPHAGYGVEGGMELRAPERALILYGAAVRLLLYRADEGEDGGVPRYAYLSTVGRLERPRAVAVVFDHAEGGDAEPQLAQHALRRRAWAAPPSMSSRVRELRELLVPVLGAPEAPVDGLAHALVVVRGVQPANLELAVAALEGLRMDEDRHRRDYPPRCRGWICRRPLSARALTGARASSGAIRAS